MYNPFVTVTNVQSCIACLIQSTPSYTIRLSHSHVFLHELSTLMKVVGAWVCGTFCAMDSNRHWFSSMVSWTEHTTLWFVDSCLWENLNLLGLQSTMYTSSVVPSGHTWWRDVSVLFQNHCQTLCKLPMFLPTVHIPLLLGHRDINASCQSCISDAEGCSTGHCIVDHDLCLGLHESVFLDSILDSPINRLISNLS